MESTGLPPLIRIRNHQNCRSSTLCRPRRRDREGAAESGPPTLEVALSEKVAQCRQVHPPPAGEVARAVRWGDHLGRVPRVDPRMDQSRSLRRFVGPAPPRAGAAPAHPTAVKDSTLPSLSLETMRHFFRLRLRRSRLGCGHSVPHPQCSVRQRKGTQLTNNPEAVKVVAECRMGAVSVDGARVDLTVEPRTAPHNPPRLRVLRILPGIFLPRV